MYMYMYIYIFNGRLQVLYPCGWLNTGTCPCGWAQTTLACARAICFRLRSLRSLRTRAPLRVIEHWYMPLRVSANDPRLRSGRLLPSSLAPLAPNTSTPTGDRTHSRLRRSSSRRCAPAAGAARLRQRQENADSFFLICWENGRGWKVADFRGGPTVENFQKKMLLKVDFLDKLDNSEQKKNRTRSWFSKKRIYATLYPRSKNSSEFVNFDF